MSRGHEQEESWVKVALGKGVCGEEEKDASGLSGSGLPFCTAKLKALPL